MHIFNAIQNDTAVNKYQVSDMTRNYFSTISQKSFSDDVERLLSMDIQKKVPDLYKDFFFVEASGKGVYSAMQALLTAGVDINATGINNHTALDNAIIYNHIEIVQFLLAAGAHLTTSAFSIATFLQRMEIFNILLNAYTEQQLPLVITLTTEFSFMQIKQENNIKMIKNLLDSGIFGVTLASYRSCEYSVYLTLMLEQAFTTVRNFPEQEREEITRQIADHLSIEELKTLSLDYKNSPIKTLLDANANNNNFVLK